MLLRPRDVAKEPRVHLGEVHPVLPGPGDGVGGVGRELLDGGGHLGDKHLPFVLANRSCILPWNLGDGSILALLLSGIGGFFFFGGFIVRKSGRLNVPTKS